MDVDFPKLELLELVQSLGQCDFGLRGTSRLVITEWSDLFCVGNIYLKAFVENESQTWRDGLAVDAFHTVFKLSLHVRVSLLLLVWLVPGLCIHWSGAQAQKQVGNVYSLNFSCETFQLILFL